MQSKLVKEQLVRFLKIDANNCIVYPFYELENDNETKIDKQEYYIYIASGAAHKNVECLLDAWLVIYHQGFTPELHLTISFTNIGIINKINDLVNFGLKIINHGFIEKSKLIELYKQSKYLIYPSLYESFGLPLIEAANYGCKIIASDLEYVHEVVVPSLVFNPYNSESIAAAVIYSIKNDIQPSKTKVKNEIDSIIDELS